MHKDNPSELGCLTKGGCTANDNDSNKNLSSSRPKWYDRVNFYLKKAQDEFSILGNLNGNTKPIITEFLTSLHKLGLRTPEALEYLGVLNEAVSPKDDFIWDKYCEYLMNFFSNKSNEGNNLDLYYDTISIEDFLVSDIHPPEMIIDPVFYKEGLVQIQAQPGVGKSWLALQIAVSVTYGENEYLGPWQVKENVGTLFVSGEDSEPILQDRLSKLIKGKGEPKAPLQILASTRQFRFGKKSISIFDGDQQTLIFEFLKQHPEYKLLILDNLGSLARGMDENNKAEFDIIGEWLTKLRSLGVCVMLIHHLGKDPRQGGRGTSAKNDLMDGIIELKNKSKDKVAFEVSFKKYPRYRTKNFTHRMAKFELELSQNKRGEFFFSYRDNQKQTKKKGDKILAALIEGNYKTQRKIAEDYGVAASHITQIKNKAIKGGYLYRNGNRKVKATDKGKEWLAVVSSFLCEIFKSQFFKERQIVSHFSYRI